MIARTATIVLSAEAALVLFFLPCSSDTDRLEIVDQAEMVILWKGMSVSIREVDPNDLRLPPSRATGVDPWKLHQQIRRFGSRRDEMPPILVYEDPDGVLEISDGVTRATRIAKLAPGETVPIMVIGHYRRSRASSPRVRDRI